MTCERCNCKLINSIYFNDHQAVCIDCVNNHFKLECISIERVKKPKEIIEYVIFTLVSAVIVTLGLMVLFFILCMALNRFIWG